MLCRRGGFPGSVELGQTTDDPAGEGRPVGVCLGTCHDRRAEAGLDRLVFLRHPEQFDLVDVVQRRAFDGEDEALQLEPKMPTQAQLGIVPCG